MAMHAPDPAAEAGASAVLPVGEVIARVQEWVDREARHLPDFAGAYLWGGITALPPDASFPLYRDVDVVVVVPQGSQEDTVEVFYRGLLLEVIALDLSAHQDAEAILANPSQGPNLATTQILADPTGLLTPLQATVAAGYSRRRWVAARCAAEKTASEKGLTAMRAAATPTDRMWGAWSVLAGLMGLLAVAQLARSTTRRTLALLGELLDAQGRPDLHETALGLLGSAHMSRADVDGHLARWVRAFDRACAVKQTPVPFGFAIQPHLRPYYVAGTQEMIAEGRHREAMFWLVCLDTAYVVLAHDAPETEKPGFAAQFAALQAALGYTSAEVWAERIAAAEQLVPAVYTLADALAARYPE